MDRVLDGIRTLLPKGTRPSTGVAAAWDFAPPHPADVFGVAASLLKRSGAYQFIVAEPGVSTSGFCILVSEKLRQDVRQAADEWRQLTDPDAVPDAVRAAWAELIACDQPLLSPDKTGISEDAKKWWIVAMKLMFIADDASEGLGYFDENATDSNWYSLVTRKLLSLSDENVPPATISQIPAAINCVLPKTRTSSVGCTLRSLSHNLCLLPAKGVATATWYDLKTPSIKDDHVPFNVLMVPLPYRLSADAFDPEPRNATTWDSFLVRQKWLGEGKEATERFTGFINELIRSAESEVPMVDAVVFPELALNWEHFSDLLAEIVKRSDVQFITAGLSVDDRGEAGNFIATALFFDTPDGRAYSYVIRPKHHRWKLDERQIRRYALSSYLDPEKTWWEGFNISQRELHILRFRKTSTIATLICEDLARVDPCQELIRSIGPSLILVLLMDGPQLRHRWPARYATVLADDPGSSVLTFTCLGLIDRQNDSRSDPKPIIALWKDDRNDAHEISMARSDHALVLSLTPRVMRNNFSLDGRAHRSIAWYLGGVHPVRAEENPYA